MAVSPAESLTLAQVADPVETIIITEKWGTVTDNWIEPFSGDMNWDPANNGKTWTAANRHSGLFNCVFFDGHAKAMQPADILASKDLTGCNLIHDNPFTPADTNVPTVSSVSPAGAPPPATIAACRAGTRNRLFRLI